MNASDNEISEILFERTVKLVRTVAADLVTQHDADTTLCQVSRWIVRCIFTLHSR